MSFTLPDSFDSSQQFIPSIANAAKLPNVSIHVPDILSVTAQSSTYLAANGVTLASTGALYDGLAALAAVERVNISKGFSVLTDRQHIYVKGEGSIRRYWNATAGNAWSAVVSPSVVVSLGSDTATITEGSGVPTGGAANDHRVDYAANVIYKNTAGTWAPLRSATAQQITLVPLTGATTLYADLHGTSAGFQITYSGPAANLTLATDAQATAAGHTPWFAGNSVDVLTLDGSAGAPTLVAPDGKSVIGSPTKEIGAACKGSNSWTVGTTDPVAVPTGAALTSGTLGQFAATTSAQLLGVISDATGTGSVVFGAAPTISNANLIGTPAAPTAAPGTNTTQIATMAALTAAVAALGVGMRLKGPLDASASPNYPAGTAGDVYFISVAGKVGGASGKAVDVSDMLICQTTAAAGAEAAVGTSWFAVEHNLVGALVASNNLSDLTNAATAWANLGGDAKARAAASATVPTVTLAVQNAAPSALEFNFSTPMYQGSIPAASALTVTKNGSAWGINGFAWNSTTKAIATMASAMGNGDTALVSFAEGTGARLLTLAGNVPLQSFSAMAVTNNVAASVAPVFTAQSAPGGTVGSFYLYPFAANGATSYAVASGSLPPGTSLSTNGFLTGTATTAGSYTFVPSATGAGGTTNGASQTIVIAAATGLVTALSVAQGDQVFNGTAWGSSQAIVEPASFHYLGTVGTLSGAGYLEMKAVDATASGSIGLGTSPNFLVGSSGNCDCVAYTDGVSLQVFNAAGTSVFTSTITYGTNIRLVRDATNAVTVQTSTDGTTYGVAYTFSAALTGTVNGYVGNVYDNTALRKVYNLRQSGLVVPQTGLYRVAPTAQRTYQRATTTGGTLGKGQGSVSVRIDTPSATPIYARTRAADGTTVLQAPWQISASASAGTLSITGIDARPDSFYLDIAPSASGPWTPSPTTIQMGRVIALEGQSLARYMFLTTGNPMGITPSPTSRAFAATSGAPGSAYNYPSWAVPADGATYTGAGVAELLRLQEIASGVACAAVGAPVGGTPISNYVPGGAFGNNMMLSVLDSAAGIEACILFVGHTDSSLGTADKEFRSCIGEVFDQHTAHNTVRGANFDRVMLTIPNINSSSWGTPENRRTIRNMAQRYCDDNGITYCAPADVSLTDGVHEDQAGGVTLARHMHRALRPGLGLTGGDQGPRVTSATRSGVNVTLTVALPTGATSLVSVGAPASRFAVFAAGTTATVLALDATTPITVGTNTIVLKLAADPGGAVDVHALYPNESISNGATNCIYDNHTDSDGITLGRQLMPTRVPVSTDGYVAAVMPLGNNATMNGDAYGASSATAFVQRLTAGYATFASNWSPVPTTQTWTWEARISHAAGNVGGSEYLAALHQDVTLKGNGGSGLRLDVADSTGTAQYVGSTPAINDGADHHVRVVVTPTMSYLYCDGALCASLAVAARNSGQSTAINSHPNGSSYRWLGTLDEVACFVTALSTGASYAVPTAPYAGTEPNLCTLYHLDGNGNAATRAAV